MSIHIREFSLTDYDQVMSLWNSCEGIGLSSADAPHAVRAYLDRNPRLSYVAEEDGRAVAAVLCGHDGRRGYLYHLAVHPSCRRRGIARRLVETCLAGLRDEGIRKCHIFLFKDNPQGLAFWSHLGWLPRDDIGVASIDLARR